MNVKVHSRTNKITSSIINVNDINRTITAINSLSLALRSNINVTIGSTITIVNKP